MTAAVALTLAAMRTTACRQNEYNDYGDGGSVWSLGSKTVIVILLCHCCCSLLARHVPVLSFVGETSAAAPEARTTTSEEEKDAEQGQNQMAREKS